MINLDNLSLSKILKLRIKDLNLDLTKEQRSLITELYNLLEAKGINWKPHVWLSDEWFSPDGVPGFAIPFTLTHKKLIQLERIYLGECEGSQKKEFLKLCCHETGHAIDNAYKLRTNKLRQKVFGLTSKKYPRSYKPNPASNDYIHFLGDHYAQAHPDEDWAETFGYFLTHKSFKKYSNNPVVLNKLQTLDLCIQNSIQKRDFKKATNKPLNYKNDSRTVEQYLLEKRKQLKKTQKNYFEKKLKLKTSSQAKGQMAHNFIDKNRMALVADVQKRTKHNQWIVEKSLKDLKEECKKNKYILEYNKGSTRNILSNVLIKNLDNYIASGRTRIYM